MIIIDRLAELRIRREVEKLEKTQNAYHLPYPTHLTPRKVIYASPAHTGPYLGAIDYLFNNGTPILAALDGRVIQVEDSHSRYGATQEFQDSLNYLTISHKNGEFSQYAHLAHQSSKVCLGQFVSTGQQIAVNGNSGWMTNPHLHFYVFRLTGKPGEFKGLRINFI